MTAKQKKNLAIFIFSIIVAIMLFIMVRQEKGITESLHYIMVYDYNLSDRQVAEIQLEKQELKEVVVVEEENHELIWLARIISAEAKGEPIEGQIAVGNVVLNRVEHEDFPNTIEEVIFQKNQFSPVNNGSVYNEPTETALEVAEMVLNGERVVDRDVLYFYNANIVSRGSWIRSRNTVEVIGNHTFAN
jgi:N-acetylmuramoyl-L-alanine amidase